MKSLKKTMLLILILSLLMTTACGQKEEEVLEDSSEEVETEDQKEEKDGEYVEEHGLKIYEDHIEFTDGLDHEVSVEKNPERVIVLYNSYLELWMENGGDVIGRLEASTGKDVVAGAEDAEVVGGSSDVSIEKIISLEPDLVVLSSKNQSKLETIPFLEENDITYMALDYDGLDDYHMLVKLITELYDREDLYEENSIKVQADIDEIIAKIPETEKTALLMGVGRSIGARDSSFWVGQIVNDLGIVNIADGNEELETSELSKEVLLEEDPDYILTLMMNGEEKAKNKVDEELSKDPAWNSLTAVEEDRVYYLDRDLLWYRPNSKYAQAYEYLARIVYPEVFGELD